MEEIDQILAERCKNWKPREMKYKKGVLRLFSQHAASAVKHTIHGDGNITDDVSLIRHVMEMNFDIKR